MIAPHSCGLWLRVVAGGLLAGALVTGAAGFDARDACAAPTGPPVDPQVVWVKAVGPRACTWTGTWDAGGGESITLVQTGGVVEGRYTYHAGRVFGMVAGSRLVGEWAQAPTYMGSDTGTFEFMMAADCARFTAFWRHEVDGCWEGTWEGRRK
jgi:hypothetical protein